MSDEEHGVGWPEDEGPVRELGRLRAALAMSRAEADDLRKTRDRWIDEHDEVQNEVERLRSALAVKSAKAAMFEAWIRDHHPDADILAENIAMAAVSTEP